jgi:hypothetical protein
LQSIWVLRVHVHVQKGSRCCLDEISHLIVIPATYTLARERSRESCIANPGPSSALGRLVAAQSLSITFRELTEGLES